MSFGTRHAEIIGAGVIWLLAIGFGFLFLMRYEFTPGDAGLGGDAWPANTRIERQTDCLHLVMAIHPRCPCSRASLDELATLLAHASQPVRAHLLVYKPSAAPAGWERGDLWKKAERIAGVTMVTDEDGVEAQSFGAQTSGQALLYARDGRLLFRGGLTASRGAAGLDPRLHELLQRTSADSTDVLTTPVFGCSLLTPASPVDLIEGLR